MNTKKVLNRCILILAIAFMLLPVSAVSVQARHKVRAEDTIPSDPPSCAEDPTCDPQLLSGGAIAHDDDKLEIVNVGLISSDLFVDGSSTDPSNILQLVDDAITVWEAAFEDESLPDDFIMYVGWADFGVLDKNGDGTVLSGELVGERTDALGEFPSTITELPAIAGDVIGLHICGKPTAFNDPNPESGDCAQSESNRKAATILFNSELLEIERLGQRGKVKLFLDTNPFDSVLFGPLSEIGQPGNRVEPLPEDSIYKDEYVVDLFTVALHEVGHALGYSRVNGVLPSAHIITDSGAPDIPDVMNPYIPFSRRKCPSRNDVEALAATGPYILNAPDYVTISTDPCGDNPERPPITHGRKPNFIRALLAILLLCGLILVVFKLNKRTGKRHLEG